MFEKERSVSPLTSIKGTKLLANLEEYAETFDAAKELGTTRSKIAITFVCWYFYLIAGTLLFILIYNPIILYFKYELLVLNPKDTLLIITTAIGSPLGFVIGYYFKDSERSSG